jgi:cytoskeleton protein RodZ
MLQDRKSNLAEGQAMMSSYDVDGAGPMAAGVGADLRAARERLGWTLPAIAGHLRIRLPYLQAIEEGRVDLLPGTAYAIGFIRTYAQALGLDVEEVSRRFRAEAMPATRKPELNFPAPVPERGVPAGAIVLVGAMIAVGAYVGWYKMSGTRHPTAAMVQPLPERLAPLAEKGPPAISPSPVLPTAPARQMNEFEPPPPVSVISPSSAAASTPAGMPFAGPSFSSAPAIAPAPAAASTQAASPAPVATPEASPPAPARSGSDTAEPAATPAGDSLAMATPAAGTPASGPVASDPARTDGGRIMLRAKADAWIQVREKSGSVLLNRVLRAGESWAVPPKGTLLMTTGNAGGTEVDLDGQPTAPIGPDGAVRRDIPLDPDTLKPAAPPAQTSLVSPASAAVAPVPGATAPAASSTTSLKKP